MNATDLQIQQKVYLLKLVFSVAILDYLLCHAVNDFRHCHLFDIKKSLFSLCVKRERGSVTRLGDLLDFGQLFKAFGNN